jgi:hypothetical protein
MRENFEQELHNALARKPEPPQLEARIHAAIASHRPQGRSMFWRWAPEMAAVAVLATGFWVRYQGEAREQAAGAAAKAHLQLALKVTVTQLSRIQQTVQTSTEDE